MLSDGVRHYSIGSNSQLDPQAEQTLTHSMFTFWRRPLSSTLQEQEHPHPIKSWGTLRLMIAPRGTSPARAHVQRVSFIFSIHRTRI